MTDAPTTHAPTTKPPSAAHSRCIQHTSSWWTELKTIALLVVVLSSLVVNAILLWRQREECLHSLHEVVFTPLPISHGDLAGVELDECSSKEDVASGQLVSREGYSQT